MFKYSSTDVRLVAETLRDAKKRDKPAHFLIGAGCSRSAGIPSATELIKSIQKEYPESFRDVPPEQRSLYGFNMAKLAVDDRRYVIRKYLEGAKINWGHIALAQLMASQFVGRVLSVNFDLVLQGACNLIAQQPAIYDFGVAPATDADLVVSPAIIHLHGQSYGLALLNTEEETTKHREKLRPILLDTLRAAPLVVVGYSGSADGVFQTLSEDYKGSKKLFWLSNDPQPSAHVSAFIAKQNYARFIGGADFDRFMIDLAQALECWPPTLFFDPPDHILREIKPVVAYPVGEAAGEIDLLTELRDALVQWQNSSNANVTRREIRHAFWRADFAKACSIFSALRADERKNLSVVEQDIVAWSFIGVAANLRKRAAQQGEPNKGKLLSQAAKSCETALKIVPNHHGALINWGIVLRDQGQCATGRRKDDLFRQAEEKFSLALNIKKDDADALFNLGSLLSQRVEDETDPVAEERLLKEAIKVYRRSMKVKPNDTDTLHDLAYLLVDLGERTRGKRADKLFEEACSLYRQVLDILPDACDTLNNLGSLLFTYGRRIRVRDRKDPRAADLIAAAGDNFSRVLQTKRDNAEALNGLGRVLIEQGKQAETPKAAELFASAEQKLKAAITACPPARFNLARLAALQGNIARCRDYMKRAEKAGGLPRVEYLQSHEDLENVRKEPWFREIVAGLRG